MAVVVVGAVGVDLLSVVSKFPLPDEKLRSKHLETQGGGNGGNVAVGLARLHTHLPDKSHGFSVRLISKMGDDLYGKMILEELVDEGVEISSIVRQSGSSGMTFVLISEDDHSRTCIHHPLSQPFLVEELEQSWLEEMRFLFLDSRHVEVALSVALYAKQHQIPILLDIEKPREGMNDFLTLCSMVNTSSTFPTSYTGKLDLVEAIEEMLHRHSQIDWIVTTLGSRGAILIERSRSTCDHSDVDCFTSLSDLESKSEEVNRSSDCLVSVQVQKEDLIIWFCPANKIDCVVDTTGCGDAFISGLIFSIMNQWAFSKLLPFATTVAGEKTKQIGARAALPTGSCPALQEFFHLENK